MRKWARANGFEVSERGRIPGDVFEAFKQRAAQVAAAAGERGAKRRSPVPDPFTLPEGAN